MNLPGHSPLVNKLLSRKCGYDLLLSILAIVGGGASALRAYKGSLAENDAHAHYDFYAFWMFFIGGASIALVSFLRFIVEWKKAETEETARDIEGCLHVLQTVLLGTLDEDDPDPGLRLTIHKPINDGKQLQQVIEYVGDDRGGTGNAGRNFSPESGVIGTAFQSMGISVGTFNSGNPNEFVDALVQNWHYSNEKAKALNPQSRSWLASPLVRTCWCGYDEVVAILYLDATVSDFFTEERILMIANASEGIAGFIVDRYS